MHAEIASKLNRFGSSCSPVAADASRSSDWPPAFTHREKTLTFLFIAAFWATPLTCWLLNAFWLKRRLHWLQLFILACIAGYLSVMLIVACHGMKDALTRQDIDANAVFGEGEASDAGLALAPLLGIPVTFVWTTINFVALSVIGWCFRTDFRSILQRNAQAEHAVELESSEINSPDAGPPYQPPR